MPTKDPVKNREYVKKSQEKRKASVGVEQFNKEHTASQMKYKNKIKSEDIDKFRKEQAVYMKEYMKQRRQKDKQEKNKTKSNSTLTDAIRARKARQELLKRAIEKANKTSNDLSSTYNTSQVAVQDWADKHKPKVGRPSLK